MNLKSPDSEVSNKNDQKSLLQHDYTMYSAESASDIPLTTQNWPTVSLDFFSLTAAAPSNPIGVPESALAISGALAPSLRDKT